MARDLIRKPVPTFRDHARSQFSKTSRGICFFGPLGASGWPLGPTPGLSSLACPPIGVTPIGLISPGVWACGSPVSEAVSYTHLRAHETVLDLVCRLLL